MNVKLDTSIPGQNIFDLPEMIAAVKHVYWITLPIGETILREERIGPNALLTINNNAYILTPVFSKVLQDVCSMLFLIGVRVLLHRNK